MLVVYYVMYHDNGDNGDYDGWGGGGDDGWGGGVGVANAMATPQQLAQMESERGVREVERINGAGLAGMTFAGVLREAGEAVVGIPRDVFGQTEMPLGVVLGVGRLRGVGAVLVAVGVAGLLLDAMLE